MLYHPFQIHAIFNIDIRTSPIVNMNNFLCYLTLANTVNHMLGIHELRSSVFQYYLDVSEIRVVFV